MSADRYNYPDIGHRIAAKIIDYFFAAFIAFTLVSIPLPSLVAALLSVVGFFAYVFLADGIPGGSLGKRIMRLSVVNWRTGRPCTFGESFIRNATFIFMGGFLKIWQEMEEEREREKGRYTGTVVISHREDPNARQDDPEREPMKFDLAGVRDTRSEPNDDV